MQRRVVWLLVVEVSEKTFPSIFQIPESRTMYINYGSTEYRLGFREKSWHKYTNILKYRERFQILLERQENF